jgi:23S rRNA (adenine2503-C2)-methyltransferase
MIRFPLKQKPRSGGLVLSRINIFSLPREKLAQELAALEGVENPSNRARLLFRDIYANRGFGLSELGVTKRLHAALESHFVFLPPLDLATIEFSETDNSAKILYRLKHDGNLIESVLVPERDRLTLCISSQVGCKQACVFCHTGQMGFTRNLTTEEIVSQVLMAEWLRRHASAFNNTFLRQCKPVSNVVFMGMGEPLDNLENVLAACDILIDDQGLRLSCNKVTVSTVGILPALDEFLSRSRASLALSLHSPFPKERTALVPANRRTPLDTIVETLKRHSDASNREYFIQYMLAQGVNDTPEHARAIANLFVGVPVKINLIPINEHDGTTLKRPTLEHVQAFQKELKNLGLVATVRISKGRDIEAACGQLVARHRRT